MAFNTELAMARRKHKEAIKRTLRKWFDQELDKPGATEYLLDYEYMVNLLTDVHRDEIATVLEGYDADEITSLIFQIIDVVRQFPPKDRRTAKQKLVANINH